METLYTAVVKAKGGRDGFIKSSDGILDFEVHKPKEMGGKEGYTNPEQLFAAAWGSCFLGALGAVTKNTTINVADASIDVHVSFNKDQGESYILSAELHLTIPGIDKTEAQKLAEKAHRVCPYSKATRGNIEVKIIAN